MQVTSLHQQCDGVGAVVLTPYRRFAARRLSRVLVERAKAAQAANWVLRGAVSARLDASRAALHAVHERRRTFFEEFVRLVRRNPALRPFVPLFGASSPSLTVETEDRPEGHVIRVAGEIDLGNVALLRAVLDPAVKNSQSVIVDLSRVTYLDSTTLHTILMSDRELRAHDCRLVVVAPPFLLKLLRITGLQDHVAAVPSLAAAAQVLKASGGPPTLD